MLKNTVQEIHKDQCTGCGACCNKCPVGAIVMSRDSEGFAFPQIDPEKCIHCGQCLKACPVSAPQYVNAQEPSCYAVMAGDDIREKSSSGGVFTVLAEWMLDRGGAVCGAAYTEDCYSVQHIMVTNREELYRLRGSKYVQSDTQMIYRDVRDCLQAGKPVLFTGTPCQIAAIHSFLGKAYDNLYTLDLVCHGVPSPMVYEKFIREQEARYGSKAVRVAFRDKKIIEWNHCIGIDFENGESYQRKRGECAYLNAFLDLLSVRKSCGQCSFAKLPRQGDMTIADFWDIHRFNPEFDDRKGTSLVLPNNEKGQAMLKVLQENAVLCAEAPLEHGIKYNAQLKYSSLLHPDRERFYELITRSGYDMETSVDYSTKRRFDIGYIGWWYGANYGSVMTNYALNRLLSDMGKTVLMLEWPLQSDEIPENKPDDKTRRFANHFYEQSEMCHLNDYWRYNDRCDTFMLGSDQLWNWWSNQDVGSYHFFLDFVDDQHKKIAYATSFGHDDVYYPGEMKLRVGYLLHRFDAVSVREAGAVQVCRRDFDLDAVQTVDPVFLCSQAAYEEAIALSDIVLDEKYVLAYILDPTEEKIEAIRYASAQMEIPYYIILDGQADFEALKARANDPNVLENVEIADWLKYFKNASYVITDSFHGFCYSIIFDHDFTVFPNELRGLSRFESLGRMTGLSDRMLYSKKEMIEKAPWNTPVDYERVRVKMQPQIEFSRQWLKDALDMPKLQPTTREFQLKTILDMQEKIEQLREVETLKNRVEELEIQLSETKRQIDELSIPAKESITSQESVSAEEMNMTANRNIKNLLKRLIRKL